ncbi:MAG: hypothetical protein FWG30_00045 [Eubacteriaceae bacterium]|nr:hypothetical protein [Eubacteriaceae bacterium]
MASKLDNRTRENIIKLHKEGKSAYAISKQLLLWESTVHSIIKLYYETGSIQPRKGKVGPKPVISDEDLLYIKALIDNEPSISMLEIKNLLELDACESTVLNAVKKRLGYTYKKNAYAQKAARR